ncbi:MAG: zf-HC2 domain-containing protein, partial [Sphaerobacter sp.]|nr:zf-HC2 domain-containing protein [Sphaerobacter sp.]
MDRHSLSHDAAADDLPAYVLGALDAEDCQAMAAHLAACPLCQQERQRLEATLGALATLAPPVSPPPDLRNRLLAQVTAKADGFGTMPPESWVTVAPPLARTRPSRWTRFALVAAAALIVGLGVWLAVLARDLAGVRADLAELRAQHALTQAALMGDARAIPLVAEG